MSTLPNTVLPKGLWVNIYQATGISIGSAISIENLGASPVIFSSSQFSPSSDSGFSRISQRETKENIKGELGLYVMSKESNGLVNISPYSVPSIDMAPADNTAIINAMATNASGTNSYILNSEVNITGAINNASSNIISTLNNLPIPDNSSVVSAINDSARVITSDSMHFGESQITFNKRIFDEFESAQFETIIGANGLTLDKIEYLIPSPVFSVSSLKIVPDNPNNFGRIFLNGYDQFFQPIFFDILLNGGESDAVFANMFYPSSINAIEMNGGNGAIGNISIENMGESIANIENGDTKKRMASLIIPDGFTGFINSISSSSSSEDNTTISVYSSERGSTPSKILTHVVSKGFSETDEMKPPHRLSGGGILFATVCGPSSQFSCSYKISIVLIKDPTGGIWPSIEHNQF